MKKNVLLIALAAVAMLTACQKKVLSERESLDRRTVSALEVQYALDGKEVQTLKFSHEYTLCELTVTVNNDGLIWNLKSDSPWCKVLPGEHRGSGKVTLELAANDRFVDRMDAILTFVAGDFQGFRIPVVQSAATFIIGQPYFVTEKDGHTYEVSVTTLEEKQDEWDFDASDWINASVKSTGAPSEGKVTKVLSMAISANDGDSRLGSVNLRCGAEKDAISVWQFGTDLSYDEGKIFFPTEKPAQLQMLAPHSVIKQVNLPDYGSQTLEEMGGNDKLTILFSEFLSDCSARRSIDGVTVTLNNNAVLSLPAMVQDYLPAYGLTSAQGVQIFAQRVAAGESTADWEKDGWVRMLNDIDMKDVTGWTGIGTTAHPFSGKFDGNGKSILNLKQSASGFFNVCAGESESNAAIIQNLAMGKSCSFEYTTNWGANTAFGGIVNEATNARIIDCSNAAPILFGGTGSGEAILGGIVGLGIDGVSIRGCHMQGAMTVACNAASAQVGGIAGSALSVINSDFAGSIVTENATLTTIYAGGITSLIGTGSTVSGNAFSGTIETNSGNVSSHFLGGLYGVASENSVLTFDKVNDMSSANGSININKYKAGSTTQIYAGGFIGYADTGCTLTFKGYEVQTKIFIDQSVDLTADAVCAGGVLGGSPLGSKLTSALFENITPQGGVTFKFAESVKSGILKGFYGGVAGFVHGPATFKNCTNKASVGTAVEDSNVNAGAKNDNSVNFMGGVAGYVEGGNSSFTGCRNEATVMNLFYCNQSAYDYDGPTYLGNFHGVICGGILGGFDMHKTLGTATLTVSDCHGTATVDGIRGLIGGIVGYAQNATISGCSYTGKETSTLGNQLGCHQGGIIGAASKAEISSCTAKTNVHAGSPGSSDYSSPGGILGRAIPTGPVTVSSCRYFGTVTAVPSNGTTLYPGGIVGAGSESTTVSNCLYGGVIRTTNKYNTSETSRNDVTGTNLEQYVIGNGVGTKTDIRLWDGN